MALDSIAVSALRFELEKALIGGRIDKVHQPEKDELTVSVRTFTENYKLVICASPSNARIHLTDKFKDNPKTAPMFCMLLRKHIQGGKITQIRQPDFERIIEFIIQTRNELGDVVFKRLIVELTGRNANIVLCEENGHIIEAARHIDPIQSSVRQILPGIAYLPPPKQDKIAFLDANDDFSLNYDEPGQLVQSVLMTQISGISPLFAREIVWLATGRCDTDVTRLTDKEKKDIIIHLERLRNKANICDFSPTLITETETGRLIDFSPFDIKQYEGACKTEHLDSMCDAIGKFYSERADKERLKQRSADITRIITTNLERLAKKLVIQQKTLKDAENKEKYRQYGDLIMSSIYTISSGSTEVVVQDYFSDNAPEISIPLKPELSPAENAQRYYKKYTKAKNAEIEVKKQIESATAEIEYLESTLAMVENCSDYADISAIRAELAEGNYVKTVPVRRKNGSEKQSKPHHFISSDGFDIYVGKNNIQNDILSLKFANTSDLWFHTKKIHGSHTVIKLGVDKDVPKTTILEAAALAAYYSKARTSSNVPVDYTTVKNVKKPSGAKPGMVIYSSYNTIYIDPKSPEELSVKEME